MTEAIVVRDNYRAAEWAAVIKSCRESGQTTAAYCREHDIKTKTYYYWLRKLRTLAAESMNGPEFIKLDIQQQSSLPMLHITYGELKMDLPGNVNLDAVCQVIKSSTP